MHPMPRNLHTNFRNGRRDGYKNTRAFRIALDLTWNTDTCECEARKGDRDVHCAVL